MCYNVYKETLIALAFLLFNCGKNWGASPKPQAEGSKPSSPAKAPQTFVCGAFDICSRHPVPLCLYLPDLFLDWCVVLSMCGSGLPESGAPIFTQLSALCDCCTAEIAFVRAPCPCFRRCYDYSPLSAKHVYFWTITSPRRSHRRQMVVIQSLLCIFFRLTGALKSCSMDTSR